MDTFQLIEKTEEFVKNTLAEAEAGHDWFHIDRVRKNALEIGKKTSANMFILELGALLHDIADSKFHQGDETIGPKRAKNFLKKMQVEKEVIDHIENIIKHISFKNTLEKNREKFYSEELLILQDADRLDAIGAIGIARAFHYGGYKNRLLYDPQTPPTKDLDKESYKKSTAPTINHFYEKLLLLKDQMNTERGKELATKRHQFMEQFLDQFYDEWNAATE